MITRNLYNYMKIDGFVYSQIVIGIIGLCIAIGAYSELRRMKKQDKDYDR